MTKPKKPRQLRDEELEAAAGGHFDEADALFEKKQQTTQSPSPGVGFLRSTDAGKTWT